MNEHYKILLSEEEKQSLKLLTSQGKHSSSKVINALILLNCDQSKGDGSHKTSREIAQMLGVGERKIDNIKKRYV